ncbi:14690_t:CDS:2, partial [Acaulospora colombiana]
LEEVKLLDAMAPDALKKEKRKDRKQSTKGPKVKKEPLDPDVDVELLSKDQAKNESQALDLSESEDEIELEDLRQHFMLGADGEDETMLGNDAGQLYLFQFPEDFPNFEVLRNPENDENLSKTSTKKRSASPSKRVSFAEDAKAVSNSKEPSKEADSKEEEVGEKPSNDDKPSGIIGHLEILQSGAVFAATQPSFLQQAVMLDLPNKKMNVLGNVSRRFVATPDIDALID